MNTTKIKQLIEKYDQEIKDLDEWAKRKIEKGKLSIAIITDSVIHSKQTAREAFYTQLEILCREDIIEDEKLKDYAKAYDHYVDELKETTSSAYNAMVRMAKERKRLRQIDQSKVEQLLNKELNKDDNQHTS